MVIDYIYNYYKPLLDLLMKFCTFGLSPADVHPGRFVFHKHRPKQAQRHASNLCQRCLWRWRVNRPYFWPKRKGRCGSFRHLPGPKETEQEGNWWVVVWHPFARHRLTLSLTSSAAQGHETYKANDWLCGTCEDLTPWPYLHGILPIP